MLARQTLKQQILFLDNAAAGGEGPVSRREPADKLFDLVRAEGGSKEEQRAILQYALGTAQHVHENLPEQYVTEDITSQKDAHDKMVELLKKKLGDVR